MKDDPYTSAIRRVLLLGFGGRAPQSSEEFVGIPWLPATILLMILPDLPLESPPNANRPDGWRFLFFCLLMGFKEMGRDTRNPT